MMKRAGVLVLAAALAGTPLACTQIGSAVKGFESSPGWKMAGEARTEMSSDVQYLGASADGMIIVRMSDGRVQSWRR
jgi:hypothetical protein